MLRTITLEVGMILQNIWKRIVCIVRINISPSNIFPFMLSLESYPQHCQATFWHCKNKLVKESVVI